MGSLAAVRLAVVRSRHVADGFDSPSDSSIDGSGYPAACNDFTLSIL
jgi:hypothetical protein